MIKVGLNFQIGERVVLFYRDQTEPVLPGHALIQMDGLLLRRE